MGNHWRVQVTTPKQKQDIEQRRTTLQEFFRLQGEAEKILKEKITRNEIGANDSQTQCQFLTQYVISHTQNPDLIAQVNSLSSIAASRAPVQVQTVPSAQYNAQAAQQHHHHHHHANSFWRGFFKVAKVVLVGAAAFVAGPVLAPVAASLGAGAASTAIGAGIVAATTDAAVQEIGVKLGCQDKFSINEVIEAGAGAGIGTAAAASGAGMAPTALTSAAGNIATQAAECTAGLRDDLDFKSAGMSAGASVVSSAIDNVMPEVNSAIQSNFPNAVNAIGNDNVTLATSSVLTASANAAVQKAVFNVDPSLEGILTNTIGSAFSQKIGLVINKAFEQLHTTEPPVEPPSKTPIGEMCPINENTIEDIDLPSNEEINKVFEVVANALQKYTDVFGTTDLSDINGRTDELINSLKNELLEDNSDIVDNGTINDENTIPPVIVKANKPQAEQSFFDSLTPTEKGALTAGIVVGAIALLPEEAGVALMLGLARVGSAILPAINQLGTALLPGVGPLPQAIAVDVAAGEAIAGTAVSASAIGFFSKLVTRLRTVGNETKSADIMLSQSLKPAQSQISRLQLSTELALKDAKILNLDGTLTNEALKDAFPVMKQGEVLNNPSVVSELTKDGSKITDWQKFSTQTTELPTGQRIQVHFYQNRFTGEINYTHIDFKVKNLVDALYAPNSPKMTDPQSLLNKNRNQP